MVVGESYSPTTTPLGSTSPNQPSSPEGGKWKCRAGPIHIPTVLGFGFFKMRESWGEHIFVERRRETEETQSALDASLVRSHAREQSGPEYNC